jgi:hypothetical protein
MNVLISSNQQLLDQAISLIRSQTPEDYVLPCETVFSSTIGQHIRHCVEHYEEFLNAVQVNRALDYEKRPRDVNVETDPDEAVRRLGGIRDGFHSALGECREIAVWDNGAVTPASSSVSRELQFLLSHTVHHFALIAVIASLRGLCVPRDFGIAPSTLKYRESA